MSEAQILLVEDDEKIAEVLQEYLQAQGYVVHHLARGDQVIDFLAQHSVDLILLDIMLPGVDGLQLCQTIRSTPSTRSIPIALTTAKVEEIDRILGWEMGADDYICKPFSLREVLARVRSLLRRRELNEQPVSQQWHLDSQRFEVCYQGRCLELSAIECELLNVLSHAPGRVFSRSQLIDSIYQDHRIVNERTIDSHIKKLRQKLHKQFGELDFIVSVYGAGYKFVMP